MAVRKEELPALFYYQKGGLLYMEKEEAYRRALEVQKHHDMTFHSSSAHPPIMKKAEGALWEDEDGNCFISLNEISMALGYGNSRFQEKVAGALLEGKLAHVCPLQQEKALLIERLLSYGKDAFEKVFFSSSGGEAVDWAVKAARRYRGKENIVTFWHGLHGRSFAGAALSGVPARKTGFGSLPSGFHCLPYPDCAACPFGQKEESCQLECITFIENYLYYGTSGDLAGIIMEPVQPLGGMACPGQKAWNGLRRLADEKEALLILDEIQTGFGRTGTMFHFEQTGILPDILLLGKGLSNGFGMGAMLLNHAAAKNMRPEEMSGGAADTPFHCTVVNTVLDILEEDNLLAHVRKMGALFCSGLEEIAHKSGQIARLRGKGLAIGIELTNIDPKQAADRLYQKGLDIGTWEKGLLIRPPLVITQQQVESSLQSIRLVLEELTEEGGKCHG